MATIAPKPFRGKWRIVETDAWSRDALDLVEPAHITFYEDEDASFAMIAVRGGLDCRFDGNRVEFSWMGFDELDPAAGRGFAELGADGMLRGKIFFHGGEESTFVAKKGR